MELHDGRVDVRSEGRGRGSEFTLTLPAAATTSVSASASESSAAAFDADGRSRLLIVDDIEDAADLLAESLGQFGHTTRVAYDGPSALQIADHFRPDSMGT